MPKPDTLTDAEIAAIASGATAALEPTKDEQAAGAAAAPATGDASTSGGASAAAASAETAEAAAAAPANQEQPSESAVVALLKEQLAAANDKITQNAVELTALKAKVGTMETTHDSLLAIARNSVAKLRIALGGSAGDAESLDAPQAAAEHARLAVEFQKKFKVGPVAATSAASDSHTKQGEKAAPPLHAAKIAATRIK